jgi:hypothetical protein
MWPWRHTFAKNINIPEFDIYEGEFKKSKYFAKKGEFQIVDGSITRNVNKEDVIESWVKR